MWKCFRESMNPMLTIQTTLKWGMFYGIHGPKLGHSLDWWQGYDGAENGMGEMF